MFGWYSEKSFRMNNIGYLYLNQNGDSKICTTMSNKDECPYLKYPTSKYKDDVIFVGMITEFIQLVHYENNQLYKSKELRLNRLKSLDKSLLN